MTAPCRRSPTTGGDVRHCILALALYLPWLAGCGGGGGSPSSPIVARDWGAIPPGPRAPGVDAPLGYQPEVTVRNRAGERAEVVAASVPFPWGRVLDVEAWSVEAQATAWEVLQRWPDGTVRVAQAQWRETFAAAGSVTRRVVPDPAVLRGDFIPHPRLAAGLPELEGEVADTFGVVYRGAFAGAAEILQQSPLLRVRRHRAYHRSVNGLGIGRDFLTSTFYVTEFADQPVVVVDWVLGNDYLGRDQVPANEPDPNLHALGGVGLGQASFRVRGADVCLPYRAAYDNVGAPVLQGDGFLACSVLGNAALSDGQTRRWRFVLVVDDPAATPTAQALVRTTAAAMVAEPLRPLATAASWRVTHALGLLGGPGSGPADAAVRAAVEFADWDAAAHFGAFGARGEPKATAQTGTPRNQPVTPELLHALQSGDDRLLTVLEQKAWVQALRPYHLYGLRVADGDDLLLWDGVPLYPGSRDLSRQSLGRRALRSADPYAAYRTGVGFGVQHAQGFGWFDVEHWSMDLLFDHWTVTGDCWAREELRQLGESLRGLLRPSGYDTSNLQAVRAEGWTMQGFVQAFVATGDLRFRDAALNRLHDVVLVQRSRHASGALRLEGTDPRTGFPEPHRYYMPWQHAGVLYGYLAGWKFFGDAAFLEVAEAAARAVDYGWVHDVTVPGLGFVADGLRYYVPVEYQGTAVAPAVFDGTTGIVFGDAPLGGAHDSLAGGLLLLAEVARSTADRELATRLGTTLLELPLGDADRWDKWFGALPLGIDF